MPVSRADVRHIAGLARLGITDERADTLVVELNGILAHMDALSLVNTDAVREPVGNSAPLRVDERHPIPLERPREQFAPAMRDGLLLVPRLSSHEGAGES